MNTNNTNKKLFEIALYAVDSDGNVVGVEKPSWYAESSEDRAKAKALRDKLDSDKDYEWNVKVLRTVNF